MLPAGLLLFVGTIAGVMGASGPACGPDEDACEAEGVAGRAALMQTRVRAAKIQVSEHANRPTLAKVMSAIQELKGEVVGEKKALEVEISQVEREVVGEKKALEVELSRVERETKTELERARDMMAQKMNVSSTERMIGETEVNMWGSDSFFAGCSLGRVRVRAEGRGEAQANRVLIQKAQTMRSTHACGAGLITLMEFGAPGQNIKLSDASQTCCPMDDLRYGGCANWAEGKCASCNGGFTHREDRCVPCADAAG